MIHMRMGNQNMANLFAVYGVENGIDVSLIVWTRIDDRDLPAAKDVGACAVKSECTGIVGNNSANARRKLRWASVAEFHFPAIGNVYHVPCLNYSYVDPFQLGELTSPEYKIGSS